VLAVFVEAEVAAAGEAAGSAPALGMTLETPGAALTVSPADDVGSFEPAVAQALVSPNTRVNIEKFRCTGPFPPASRGGQVLRGESGVPRRPGRTIDRGT